VAFGAAVHSGEMGTFWFFIDAFPVSLNWHGLQKLDDKLWKSREFLDGNRTRQVEPVLYSQDIVTFYHLEGRLQKNYPIEKGGVIRKTW
jgi:hypothetical protein